MESGLEDRNNVVGYAHDPRSDGVSMESGLEDRNNEIVNGTAPPEAMASQWSPA